MHQTFSVADLDCRQTSAPVCSGCKDRCDTEYNLKTWSSAASVSSDLYMDFWKFYYDEHQRWWFLRKLVTLNHQHVFRACSHFAQWWWWERLQWFLTQSAAIRLWVFNSVDTCWAHRTSVCLSACCNVYRVSTVQQLSTDWTRSHIKPNQTELVSQVNRSCSRKWSFNEHV